jgi:hypothetical protein
MIDLELSWQEAAVTSAVLLAGTAAAIRMHRPRLARVAAFTREAGILVGLFSLWQFAGQFSSGSLGDAMSRSEWIWHTERVMHLPSEATLQQAFLPHPLLVQACNLFYASLHFVVLIGCLVWLFSWHRDRYGEVRTTVVLLTGFSLLIQFIAVAPPRMLPGDGMSDTAIAYGQSVYGSVAGFNADELSAMPSVHIGWALLVAVVVVRFARSRWRWLALLYPAVTMLVVVITANHFWLDGIVAGLLLVLVLVLQWAGRAIAAAPARTRPAGPSAEQPAAPGIHSGTRPAESWVERDPQGSSHDLSGRPVLQPRDL